MSGVPGKSGGTRKGAGRKRDLLCAGKEILVRRKLGTVAEESRVYVVTEYTPKRIVLREKDGNEEIIIRG